MNENGNGNVNKEKLSTTKTFGKVIEVITFPMRENPNEMK